MRKIVIIVSVLVVLCVSLVLMFVVVQERMRARLQARAQSYGWGLELGDVGMDGLSKLCIGPNHIENVEAKAQISVSRVCIPLRISLLMGKVPNEVELHDVHASFASMKNIMRKKEVAGEQRTPLPSTARAWPRLSIQGYDLQFNNNALSARCFGPSVEFLPQPTGLAANFAPQCSIKGGRGDISFQSQISVPMEAQLSESGQNLGMGVKFSDPVKVQTQWRGKTGDFSFSGLGVRKTSAGLQVSVLDTGFDASPWLGWLKQIQVHALEISLDLGSERFIRQILLVRPAVDMDLEGLLNIAELAEVPLLAELKNRLIPHGTKEVPSTIKSKGAGKAGKAKPLRANAIKAFREQCIRVQEKLQSIPPVLVEEGSVRFLYGEESYVVDALSFGSALDQDTDAHNIGFGFGLRGARLHFDLNFPEDELAFPTLDFKVEGLSPKDLFTILSLPNPKEMSGSFDGRIILGANEEAARLELDARFSDFAIFHPMISQSVLSGINVGVGFTLEYIFSQDLAKVEDLRLSSGPVVVNGSVQVTGVRAEPVLSFKLSSKELRCEDIPKAFPPGILPSIADLRIEGGRMNPELYGKIPLREPIKLTLGESGFEGCAITSVAPHFPERLNDADYTFTFTRYTSLEQGITVGPGTGSYVPIAQIPPYVLAAMYLTEDKRFFDHGPLRISFIERAMRLNLQEKRYVYGGSTISQQLVKNLFLDRHKNLARKLEEAFIAWRMETVVNKMRIFELYVNMIEFGPDIYGIKQAAYFYFNKMPQDLTPLEGAYLASLKVAPSKGGRFYLSGFSKKAWWNKRMKYILKILAEQGYISPAQVLAAYPWIPEFYYPDPADTGDLRNIWLKKHGQGNKSKLDRAQNKPRL